MLAVIIDDAAAYTDCPTAVVDHGVISDIRCSAEPDASSRVSIDQIVGYGSPGMSHVNTTTTGGILIVMHLVLADGEERIDRCGSIGVDPSTRYLMMDIILDDLQCCACLLDTDASP
jgi:hypothetical protein